MRSLHAENDFTVDVTKLSHLLEVLELGRSEILSYPWKDLCGELNNYLYAQSSANWELGKQLIPNP
ncbi:hypothetical protein EMPG_11629 [Blastomyces silverae]|uniref:Uncharacterized protein n=1 Tax=Blastomyces silverae TaxID=2060906 RepID=A0A0H1BPI6_9EURO|nr:hypothetical protein EMPG_11629 [Blastomyces silverae]